MGYYSGSFFKSKYYNSTFYLNTISDVEVVYIFSSVYDNLKIINENLESLDVIGLGDFKLKILKCPA